MTDTQWRSKKDAPRDGTPIIIYDHLWGGRCVWGSAVGSLSRRSPSRSKGCGGIVYGLPPLEDLFESRCLAAFGAGQTADFAKATRSFDNFMPGYRESANVEDRRGSFETCSSPMIFWCCSLLAIWRRGPADEEISLMKNQPNRNEAL